MAYRVAGTGHRPNKLGGYGNTVVHNRLREVIRQELITYKALYYYEEGLEVISGMALGLDQWLAEEALDLDIRVIAAIPCKGQESRWPAHSQEHYHRLLAHPLMSIGYQPDVNYSARVMDLRNRWMVDNSDELLALWNGTRGGTANCYYYAAKKNGYVINLLDPKDYM